MWPLSSHEDLKGKVAIVTGASRGIGAACAYALARRGANVAIVDLLPADDIRGKIETDFPEVQTLGYEIDIRNKGQVVQAVQATAEQWGHIDILVNNAGTCSRLSLEAMTEEDWDRDISTNLKGSFFFTQAVVFPYMKEQGYGKIINISSISGMIGGVVSSVQGGDSGRSGPAYAASKGGVNAFTKWVAKEVGKYGIYCNAIAPGSVVTELTRNMNYPVDNQPIQRMGEPEDIAEAVVYLASPASNYVSGQVLKVCGGLAIG
ncbi:SDR family NAD(P)-dependent oxidoreductase [Ammoniphilus sp. YIM 78166]|uniref:SDR family NAD(P)-dependent oxidoreductase n=1 Tax=Ammoniphilus sp. YIM 78166 TaxID=1644106 RepID=UPI00106F4343|nr:SDR family NAD(P)-dependent oxidoreductase [Ammoniphilus sp. YIM 78166]